jgi:hypothetical protein
MLQEHTPVGTKNIVLVHGGFVDGSGWEGVYKTLRQRGYTVAIVQNPTISLAGDVAVTKRTIAAMDGPVVLVGHSYGGAVITEAGNDRVCPRQGRFRCITDQRSAAWRTGTADSAAARWFSLPG